MWCHLIWLSLCLVLTLGQAAVAWPEDYGPFVPGREPRLFKLHVIENGDYTSEHSTQLQQYTFSIRSGPRVVLKIRLEEKTNYAWLSVLDPTGRVIAGPEPVADYLGPFQAYYGDLNHDGREDFVVTIPTMGCGLGAENVEIAFAISDADTYRITSIMSMSPGPEDFIDIDRDGRCEVIQSAFIYNDAENERDRRLHNYRVYHLLEINKGGLVVSSKDKRFPRWIWYTFNPNHQPTTRLTPAVKKALWEEQGAIFLEPAQPRATTSRPAIGNSAATQPSLSSASSRPSAD